MITGIALVFIVAASAFMLGYVVGFARGLKFSARNHTKSEHVMARRVGLVIMTQLRECDRMGMSLRRTIDAIDGVVDEAIDGREGLQ